MPRKLFDIVVTGIGALSPLGRSPEKIWSALCNGQSGIATLDGFENRRLPTAIGGEIPLSDIAADSNRPMSTANKVLIRVAEQALDGSGIGPTTGKKRVGLHLAIPSVPCKSHLESIRKSMLAAWSDGAGFDPPVFAGAMRTAGALRPNFSFMFPFQYLAEKYNLRGEFTNINVACATGAQILYAALESLYAGRADAALAAGVNTNIDPYYLVSMEKLGALSSGATNPQAASRPFDAGRNGFVMAEGAGALLLERFENAKQRDAPIYGAIGGVGISADAWHPTAPEPSGAGMVRAMRKALASAGCQPGHIDYINAHGTGTPLNDRLESRAIKTVFGPDAARIRISATKSMTGHMFTAAGILETIFSMLSCRDDVIPPTINYETPDPDCDLQYVTGRAVKTTVARALSNSFGFGGQNACVVVEKFNEKEFDK